MMKIKLQLPPSGVLKTRYNTLLPMHSHSGEWARDLELQLKCISLSNIVDNRTNLRYN